MQVAVSLNVHSHPEVVIDTIDSIKTYLTHDILVVIDGASNSFNNISLPTATLNGLPHNISRSPYKNVALSLMNLYESYPNHDWYCYTEYDCLFTSDRILTNLKIAKEKNIWMLGNDGHVDDIPIPFLESIMRTKFNGCYYLLGACQFFSNEFLGKLMEMEFFDKLLLSTSPYSDGFFPLYQGYDISEHMYPTLARHFGGLVGVFATYDYATRKWHGSYKVFPVRWRPELDLDTENFPEASIMHPLKEMMHPIRVYHRNKRQGLKNVI